MKHAIIAAAIVAIGGSASAQSLPTLDDFAASVTAEVTALGRIGLNDERAAIFVADGDVYPAQLALTREETKAITDNCRQTNMFMETGLCTAEVDAEVRIAGSRVTLTIFAVRNLEPGA